MKLYYNENENIFKMFSHEMAGKTREELLEAGEV